MKMLIAAVHSPAITLLGVLGFILFPWLFVSVVAYIYYCTKGTKPTFHNVMTRRSVLISSAILLGFCFLAQLRNMLSAAN